jgi:hypothetical protein
MFINKYFWFCDRCNAKVKPNKGFVEKKDGKWKTFCNEHGYQKNKEFLSKSASAAKEHFVPASRRSGW